MVWVVGVSAQKEYRAPESYVDGRSQAVLRMTIDDEGMVMPCGTGPDSCDTYGAREAVVVEHEGVYYLHYDGAGKDGWLSCLATSRDLRHWEKHGLQLTLGEAGRPDSKSASSPWLVNDGAKWHMFYVGTQFCTPAPDCIPATPYVTLTAEADHPAGPWRKRYDIIPFTNEAGTYYSDTASPGDVVEQDGGTRCFSEPRLLTRKVNWAVRSASPVPATWGARGRSIRSRFSRPPSSARTPRSITNPITVPGSCLRTTSGYIPTGANIRTPFGCIGPKT